MTKYLIISLVASVGIGCATQNTNQKRDIAVTSGFQCGGSGATLVVRSRPLHNGNSPDSIEVENFFYTDGENVAISVNGEELSKEAKDKCEEYELKQCYISQSGKLRIGRVHYGFLLSTETFKVLVDIRNDRNKPWVPIQMLCSLRH